MKEDQYRTIKGESNGLYKEKGSKFIAIAVPAKTVEEAGTALEEIRKSYHDARHHCYAYRIGVNGEEYRMNDDGEPSGTAGRPIYNQILSNELTDIIVVVVRYFGGTKLGTGGLIRAYKTAAGDALGHAKKKIKTVVVRIEVSFPYSILNDIMRLIKEEDASIEEQDFREECRIIVTVRKIESQRVADRFSAVFPARVKMSNSGKA